MHRFYMFHSLSNYNLKVSGGHLEFFMHQMISFTIHCLYASFGSYHSFCIISVYVLSSIDHSNHLVLMSSTVLESFGFLSLQNIAACAIFLASKAEEHPNKLNKVIVAVYEYFSHDSSPIDPKSEVKFCICLRTPTLHTCSALSNLLLCQLDLPSLTQCTISYAVGQCLDSKAILQNILVAITR